MKVMHPYISCILLLCGISCQSSESSLVPWHGLSYVHTADTEVLINNIGATQIDVEIKYFSKVSRATNDEMLSIPAQGIKGYHIDLFRPETISIKVNDEYVDIILIPNKKMEIEVGDELKFVGENRQLYTSLGAESDLTQELTNDESLPDWLVRYLQREKKLYRQYLRYQKAGYNHFVSGEIEDLSNEISLTKELLDDSSDTQYHLHHGLLVAFKQKYDLIRSSNYDADQEKYLHRKNVIDYIYNMPDVNGKHDILASALEGYIRKQKDFSGRRDIIQYGLKKLPLEYSEPLVEIAKSYENSSLEELDIEAVLQTPLLVGSGKNGILKMDSSKYTLLKYWFADCAPCKKQIPYENKLSEKYSQQLEVLYICHSTDRDAWNNYRKEHTINGKHFLLEGKAYDTHVDAVHLGYSPRYILLDKDKQVVCSHCPNPNDEKLENILEKQSVG